MLSAEIGAMGVSAGISLIQTCKTITLRIDFN